MSRRVPSDHAEAWQRFAARLSRAKAPEAIDPPAPEGVCPVLHELVLSFCHWEATPTQAATAYARLRDGVVDFNELRVCFESELEQLLGPRHPNRELCAARLRAALQEVYIREQELSLASLVSSGKREARAYLDALEGMTPFVSARVVLLALGGHAFPLDDRLRKRLVQEGVLDPSLDAEAAGSWLERQVRAGEAEGVYRRLEAWAGAARRASSRKPAAAGVRSAPKGGTRKRRAE